ncbi:DUF5915 domain-containing protein, partial [bacterium]|nr:DUF5915 domain-containing protein [bacterium]
DLSNWYVRRCRRRFWKSEMGPDKLSAYGTLHEVLIALSKLMAPFTPFISDEIFLNLVAETKDAPQSVHLTEYPRSQMPAHTFRDLELEERMAIVRRVVFLGRALRNEAGLKVRQPLSRIIVASDDEKVRSQIQGMNSLVLEELNIKEIAFVSKVEELTIKKAIPKFKNLGPKFGKQVREVSEIVRNLGEEQIQVIIEKGEHAFQLAGQQATIEAEDIEIITQSAEGLVVQHDDTLSVAMDTRVTETLHLEGLAREFVNRVQNMRKSAGFDVIDRIKINYETSDQLDKAIDAQSTYIKNETLAEQLVSNSGDASYSENWEIDGIKTKIGIEKVR